MRVAYVVLMLLAFLSGCAARPVIRNQQSASVFPADQNSGPSVRERIGTLAAKATALVRRAM